MTAPESSAQDDAIRAVTAAISAKEDAISAQHDAVRDVQAQLSAIEAHCEERDTQQLREQLTHRLRYHMHLVVVEKQLLVELYKAKRQSRRH